MGKEAWIQVRGPIRQGGKMSINSIDGDMVFASDPSLAKLFKKCNELVKEANENFKSMMAIKNEIAIIHKDLKGIKTRMMNLG